MADERDFELDVVAHQLRRPLPAAAEDADDSLFVRQADSRRDRVHLFTTARPERAVITTIIDENNVVVRHKQVITRICESHL